MASYEEKWLPSSTSQANEESVKSTRQISALAYQRLGGISLSLVAMGKDLQSIIDMIEIDESPDNNTTHEETLNISPQIN